MVSVHRMPVSVMYVVDVFAMGFSGMPAGLVVGVVMRLGRSVHTLQGALVIVVGKRPVSDGALGWHPQAEPERLRSET